MSEVVPEVNAQEKDGDPRKLAFIRQMLNLHPETLRIWREFGLLQKIKKGEKIERKHGAPEHMITAAAGAQALGQLLQEAGKLTGKDVLQLEQSALVHDAGKELEWLLVKAASERKLDISKISSILSAPNIKIDNQETFVEILLRHAPRLTDPSSTGVRALAAFTLSSEINALRLKAAGVGDEVIQVQGFVAFNTCPEAEELLKGFNNLEEEQKRTALKKLVMHYVDDIITSPNKIDPTIIEDDNGNRLNALSMRIKQNQKVYADVGWNVGWKDSPRNTRPGETALDMQLRVGQMVERFLAEQLGLEDPLRLPALIDQRIQQSIKKASSS